MKVHPFFLQKNSHGEKMASRNGIIYEFGKFRLIPGEGLLLRDGEPVQLSLKTFSTLVFLVERHGHLVLKSELLDSVWADSFVEEGALSRCIWTIRHALTNGSKEDFIQTIPRRGYRFIAPVSVLNHPVDSISQTLEAISTGYRLPIIPDNEEIMPASFDSVETTIDPRLTDVQPRRWQLPKLALILLLLFGAFAAVVFGYVYFGLVEVAVLDAKSIAVLPFKPVNATNRDEFFEMGVTDALIHRFGSAEKTVVRPLGATRKYTDINQDPIQAGRELQVNYVVDATYHVVGGKMRVTAQMINVATGQVEGTHKVDVDASASIAMQDVVADEIGKAFLPRLSGRPLSPARWKGTENEDAYQLYQLAMALVDKGGNFRETALGHLRRAVELDPNYAQAWAGIARVIRSGLRTHSQNEYRESIAAIDKALQLDPNLSEAYTSLCDLKLLFEYDADGAEAACKRAVELDPQSADARLMNTFFLTSRGRFDEAIAEIKVAMDIEPASYRIQRQYGNTLAAARRYDEAEQQYKRAGDLNRDRTIYRRLLRIYEAQGRQSEALDNLLKLFAADGKDAATIERFRTMYLSSGWRAVIVEAIKMREAEAEPRYFEIAEWYAYLGNKDKAFENLEMAYQRRNMLMIFLRVDSHHFDSLRDDPRFEDLIRRIEGK